MIFKTWKMDTFSNEDFIVILYDTNHQNKHTKIYLKKGDIGRSKIFYVLYATLWAFN